MLKAPRKQFILLLIFAFSFIYRMLLMFWNNFPPGADIGLHNSVIYSITGSGSTNFLHNAFQFGGGTSLTFPGYHIFASSMMLMTGLPEYIAQAAIVALFSSLIVLCTFLITKIAWSERAAFIVSFLAAISRFDIEMTLWGGYPNVITLMLIPLTFYFYLQKDRFSIAPFSSFNFYSIWFNIFNTFFECRHFRGCNIHHCTLHIRCTKNFQNP